MFAMTSNSVTGNFLHVMAIFIRAQSFKVTFYTGTQDRLALPNLHTCQPCYSYIDETASPVATKPPKSHELH